MDIATILGIVIAIGSILAGQALEGGHIGSVLQLTAFIIVMGGHYRRLLRAKSTVRRDQIAHVSHPRLDQFLPRRQGNDHADPGSCQRVP